MSNIFSRVIYTIVALYVGQKVLKHSYNYLGYKRYGKWSIFGDIDSVNHKEVKRT